MQSLLLIIKLFFTTLENYIMIAFIDFVIQNESLNILCIFYFNDKISLRLTEENYHALRNTKNLLEKLLSLSTCYSKQNLNILYF